MPCPELLLVPTCEKKQKDDVKKGTFYLENSKQGKGATAKSAFPKKKRGRGEKKTQIILLTKVCQHYIARYTQIIITLF